MKTKPVPDRHALLSRHLHDIVRSPDLRDEFDGLNDALLGILVDASCKGAETFVDARRNAMAHVSVAKEMSKKIRGWRGVPTRWSDVLTMLLGNDEYLESFAAMTVGEEVLVELIAALYEPKR